MCRVGLLVDGVVLFPFETAQNHMPQGRWMCPKGEKGGPGVSVTVGPLWQPANCHQQGQRGLDSARGCTNLDCVLGLCF